MCMFTKKNRERVSRDLPLLFLICFARSNSQVKGPFVVCTSLLDCLWPSLSVPPRLSVDGIWITQEKVQLYVDVSKISEQSMSLGLENSRRRFIPKKSLYITICMSGHQVVHAAISL